MKFLGLTLPTPAENLALDEALLTAADNSLDSHACEVLRIWRASEPFVVLGRSSQYRREVHAELACQRSVPILRRFSGGAAVVLAPGCLLYSLLIRLDTAPGLRMLDVAHRFVMGRMLKAINKFEPKVRLQGTSDLTLQGRKLSGNSLRVGRNWMLYHGTLLLDMELSLVDELLQHPPCEPVYRERRSHGEFLINLKIDERALIAEIRDAWQADQALADIPLSAVPMLVRQKYGQTDWNLQR